MKIYVAFLRAINVGGTKIIKMDALKGMFESLGLTNVRTFIQSGNVIFEANEKNPDILEQTIERHLEKVLGYKVEVFVRSMRDLEEIANQKHFTLKESDTFHIVFLRKKATKAEADKLKQHESAVDQFAVIGREVYNLRRDKDKSVFSNSLMETIFGVTTTRNLNTINRIVEKYCL